MDGLMQERRNSIANALELSLSCTNPSIFCVKKGNQGMNMQLQSIVYYALQLFTNTLVTHFGINILIHALQSI